MLDRQLRPRKAQALDPLVERLPPVSATTMTVVGLTIGLAGAGLAAIGWWSAALVAWLVNRLADGLDGEIARRNGTVSDRGGYLDLLADAAVYGSIPVGVAAGVDSRAAWVVAALLLASFYLNMTSVVVLSALLEKRSGGAATRGQSTSVVLPPGLVEGAETIVFFSLILAFPSAAVAIMAVMAAAVTGTVAGRLRSAWPLLAPPTGPGPASIPSLGPGPGTGANLR